MRKLVTGVYVTSQGKGLVYDKLNLNCFWEGV